MLLKHKAVATTVQFNPIAIIFMREILRSRIIGIVSFTLLLVTGCKKEGKDNIKPDWSNASAASLTPKPVALSTHSKGYYEYLPEGYLSDSSGAKYPLIIFFHGGAELGSNASELNKLLTNGPLRLVNDGTLPKSFMVNGQEFRFIIIAPQFTSSDGSFPDEIDAIIEYSKKSYKVDASRIYLTGLSFGGGLCWNYAGRSANYARKIAAMVPIGSYIAENREDFKVDAPRGQNIVAANLPIWSTHNGGDNVCPLSWIVNAHKLVANARPAPRLTILDGNTHGGWEVTYNPGFKENGMNIYEWMLQYRR